MIYLSDGEEISQNMVFKQTKKSKQIVSRFFSALRNKVSRRN